MAVEFEKLCRLIAEKLQRTPRIERDQLVADIRQSIEADPSLMAALQIDRHMVQNNQGETTAFQTLVESGIAYIGTHYHFDDNEKIKEVLELLLQQYIFERPQNVYTNRFLSVGQYQQESGFNMLALEFESSNLASILNMAACGGISELAQVNHWLKKLLEKQQHNGETEGSSELENSSKLLERDVSEGTEAEDTEDSIDMNEKVFLEEYSPDHEVAMFEEEDYNDHMFA